MTTTTALIAHSTKKQTKERKKERNRERKLQRENNDTLSLRARVIATSEEVVFCARRFQSTSDFGGRDVASHSVISNKS